METERPISEYRSSYVWRGSKTEAKGTNYEELVRSLIKTGPITKQKKPVTDYYENFVLDMIQKGKANTAPVFPPKTETELVEKQKEIVHLTQPIPIPEVEQPKIVKTATKMAPSSIISKKKPASPKISEKPSAPKSSRFISTKPEKKSVKGSVTVHSPVFYSKPDQCPSDERQNLQGPFWVVWPKGKELPSKYKELNKVVNY